MFFAILFCAILRILFTRESWQNLAKLDKIPAQGLSSSQVAENLGYSSQSVRNAAKELGIEPQRKGNRYVFTAEQANAIAAHFGKEPIADESEEQRIEENEESPSDVLELLKKQMEIQEQTIELLREQLKEKDAQINSLIETNRAFSAERALTTAAEKKELLLADSTQEEKKKGFWARLFNV